MGIVTFKNNIVYHTGVSQYAQSCINITLSGSMVHSNNALFPSAGATMTVVAAAGTYKSQKRWCRSGQLMGVMAYLRLNG